MDPSVPKYPKKMSECISCGYTVIYKVNSSVSCKYVDAILNNNIISHKRDSDNEYYNLGDERVNPEIHQKFTIIFVVDHKVDFFQTVKA